MMQEQLQLKRMEKVVSTRTLKQFMVIYKGCLSSYPFTNFVRSPQMMQEHVQQRMEELLVRRPLKQIRGLLKKGFDNETQNINWLGAG